MHLQLPISFDRDIAVKEIVSRIDLSTKQLTKMYVHHWKSIGELEYKCYTSALYQLTGETLRVDHTYKIARSVTAFSEKMKRRVCCAICKGFFDSFLQVAVKASLFSILNEHGHVLVTSLVPNDCRVYFFQAFQALWMAEGRDEYRAGIKTKFVYTDDVRKGTYGNSYMFSIIC